MTDARSTPVLPGTAARAMAGPPPYACAVLALLLVAAPGRLGVRVPRLGLCQGRHQRWVPQKLLELAGAW